MKVFVFKCPLIIGFYAFSVDGTALNVPNYYCPGAWWERVRAIEVERGTILFEISSDVILDALEQSGFYVAYGTESLGTQPGIP